MKALLALVLMLLMSPAWGEGNPEDAQKLVNERIHALLARIEQLKALPSVNEQQRMLAVEEVIGSVVDFKRITRRVMAKYYKKSSKQQKIDFYTVFKQTLLNTYVKGLWEFEDYKIRIKPLKSARQSLRNTQVEFEVVTASGQVFPVIQSLFFHKKQRRWLVQNVIISGVNIGQLFRDQFARLVTQNHGDLDLAIQAWALAVKPVGKSRDEEVEGA
ncbi:MAG: ABC transporter substrate-binding protein [Bermanella sp.]|jgi:ABC-type transport system involved in resistance to organic solvents, auxiliary component